MKGKPCHKCGKTFMPKDSFDEAFCQPCLNDIHRGCYFAPMSNTRPPACPRMGICLEVEPTRVYLYDPKYRGLRRRRATPQRRATA